MSEHVFWAPQAWVNGRWEHDVCLEVDARGHWAAITPGIARAPAHATVLRGPVLPGMVNAHSHAFQRAFAGLAERRESEADDFWSWRDRMYGVALRITPAQLDAAIKHLHGFCKDVTLTHSEFIEACMFLARAGAICDDKRQEFILLGDILGVEVLCDMLTNPVTGSESESTVLGPFYRENPPVLPHGASTAQKHFDNEETVFMEGYIKDTSGRPLAGVTLDIWEDAPNGLYENHDHDQPDYNLRGRFETDENGYFALRALRPVIASETVTGQYRAGAIAGQAVPGYDDELGKDSSTETFVAIKAHVDNWRWKGVPFMLRTGKRMIKRYSEIVINFREVKHNIFPSKEKLNNNKLIIRLQPEERIELIQMTKIPGPGGYRYKPIALKLDYNDSFKERFPEAYERLIVDVIRGNQTLFMRQDELQAAWTWIESVTSSWKAAGMTNVLYEAGTWGPGDDILDENESWITKTWRE